MQSIASFALLFHVIAGIKELRSLYQHEYS